MVVATATVVSLSGVGLEVMLSRCMIAGRGTTTVQEIFSKFRDQKKELTSVQHKDSVFRHTASDGK